MGGDFSSFLFHILIFLRISCSWSVQIRELDPMRVARLQNQRFVPMPKSYFDKYPKSLVFIGKYLDTNEFDIRCCGSILHARIVLTVARCEPLPENFNDYTVIGGTTDINDLSKLSTNAIQLRRIAEWTNHPEFNDVKKDNISTLIYYDMAIVKLRTNFIFGTKISAAPLPITVYPDKQLLERSQCVVIALPDTNGLDSSLRILKLQPPLADQSVNPIMKRSRSKRIKREELANIDELYGIALKQFNNTRNYRKLLKNDDDDDEEYEKDENKENKDEDEDRIEDRIVRINKKLDHLFGKDRIDEDKDSSMLRINNSDSNPAFSQDEDIDDFDEDRKETFPSPVKSRMKSKFRMTTGMPTTASMKMPTDDSDIVLDPNDYITFEKSKTLKRIQGDKLEQKRFDQKNKLQKESTQEVSHVKFSCQSNQGVPMFCHSKENEVVQMGFRTLQIRENCAKVPYQYFTRVDSALEWISSKIPQRDGLFAEYEEEEEDGDLKWMTKDDSYTETTETKPSPKPKPRPSNVKIPKSSATLFRPPRSLNEYLLIDLLSIFIIRKFV